jgi:hypothetical protein
MGWHIAGNGAAMADTQNGTQDSMADAVHTITDQSQKLARREMRSALLETWQKATASAPALGLLAASGGCTLLAAASSYRLSLRLLEKRLSPVSAALAATLGFGGAAAAAATLGTRWLRNLPPPVPTRTARRAEQAVAAAAGEAGTQRPE